MSQDVYLVPDRECGACTACCKELAIVEAPLMKMPGVPCIHCTAGQGCAIYDARPTNCRAYHCLWRSMEGMSDAWRPDLSGIMMVPAALTPGYGGPFAVSLVVVGDPDILKSEAFASLVAGFIDCGTATNLDVPGAPGMYGHATLLNPVLTDAIAARDLPKVRAVIWNAYLSMRSSETRAITTKDLVSAQPIAAAV